MNAMKKLRPIEMPKPQDPYRKAQMGLLRHFALSEAEFRALERERPGIWSWRATASSPAQHTMG